MSKQTAVEVSGHQAGAGGALRCAVFAIEDAARQLEWHFQSLGLSRDELLQKQAEISSLRIAAGDALKPLWKLAGSDR